MPLPFAYRLEVARRRRVTVFIDPSGEVIVKAPRYVIPQQLEKFLHQCAPWVDKRRKQIQHQAETYPPRFIVSGEQWPVDGQLCTLEVSTGEGVSPGCRRVENSLQLTVPVGASIDDRRRLLQRWYAKQTLAILEADVPSWANKLQVSPRKVILTKAQSRWGSCSPRGVVRYHWKLSMMGKELRDCIIVHELSHLRELNHSERFWALVTAWFPEHRSLRRWLRKHTLMYRF